VQQVGAQDTSATLATVDAHLDMLRPAIANYGGSVVVRAQC
jgi:alanine racemase